MKRFFKLLIAITLLLALVTGTLSYGDVGNHNSFDFDSDFDIDVDSGSGDLASLLQFLVIFFRSPWYIKLIVIIAIVLLIKAQSSKERKLLKKYVQCDKSFLKGLDTTEDALKEMAKAKYTNQLNGKPKPLDIEIARFEQDENYHRITFLFKLQGTARSNYRYALMLLAHPAIMSGSYDYESFNVLSFEEIKK